MKKELNSRKRVLTTLEHRQPDRCATCLMWIHPAALKKLEAFLGVQGIDEVEKTLHIDPWRRVYLPDSPPADYDARLRHFVPEKFLCADGIRILDDGRAVKNHSNARYLEHVLWYPLQEVQNVAQLRDYPFYLPEDVQPITEEMSNEVCRLRQSDAIVYGVVAQPFKTACNLRGMENFLCDLLVNHELAEALYDRLYAVNTAQAVRLAEAGVDIVQVVGDIAMQDRLLMSPEIWRRFEKLRLSSFIRQVKRANPMVKVFMHSDGKMTEIIPDLVEIGLDILNPIQPECMNPMELKKNWGNQLVLHGCVSVQRTIPLGTVAQVRDEVRCLVDNCNTDGGFVLSPANTLLPEFPVENIVAMYEVI